MPRALHVRLALLLAAILIPARFRSSRFPGKPLAALRGAEGEAKPLIRRAWEAAMAAEDFAEVAVITDDGRIAEAAEGFGARVILTPESCRNGTERCAAALEGLDPPTDPLATAWYRREVAGIHLRRLLAGMETR